MRKLLLTLLCLSVSVPAFGHLCNDVFIQAKDNLAVKVDIRDGQLRIGEQASFRVYLLNTMDRDIVEIFLEVQGQHFDAGVDPSPSWHGYPRLKAVRRGGKKEYFAVTLRRKRGVRDGRYKIGLRLYSKRQRRAFKTVDLDKAAGTRLAPRAGAIKIDGKAEESEWKKALVCANFSAYVKQGRYFVNRPAREQARVRLSWDEQNLYCLLNFQGGRNAVADVASIYVAPTSDAEPVAVRVNRKTCEVRCDRGIEGVEVKAGPTKNVVECKIPRKLLGIENVKDFRVNFTRTTISPGRRAVTYWRGNSFSVRDPIVYGHVRTVE